MTRKLIKSIGNIPGWSTKRKIVVFESDDWGSVRMSSVAAFEKLKKAGIDESGNHYNMYDALECNLDLNELFDTLTQHSDMNGNNPVFTAACIVANPDFEKIKQHNFTTYFFEPFTNTLNKYPAHDKVMSFYKTGMENKIFVPVFHGREHLNVNRWMNALKNNHKTTRKAFEYGVTGVYKGINNEIVPNFQAAFDLENLNEINDHEKILESGIELFNSQFNHKPCYFVPPNGRFNNALEMKLHAEGVKYIYSDKLQNEPVGNGKSKRNMRFIGQKNKFKQIYISRNCVFEPASLEHSQRINWVENCLNDIQNAFFWNKPAIISSHRVNYSGFLHPQNRENGLKQLNELLERMLKRWPNIEFLSSVELAQLIEKQ